MPGRPKNSGRKTKAKTKPRPRPRKRSRAGGSWRPDFLHWALGLVLAVGGVALAWLWGGAPEQPAPPPPLPVAQQRAPAPAPTYPPPPATPSPAQQMQAMDEALLSALRQAGVEPGQLRMRFVEEPQGEVTLLLAALGPGQDPAGLEKALERAVAQAKGKGVWQREAGRRQLRVSLAGKTTHQVNLDAPAETKPAATPGPAPRAPAPAVPPPAQPPARPAGGRPLVAIVIDDVGYQPEITRRLLALDLALTFSVLPHSPHGRELAELARTRGRQVLLHLPMEAQGGGNPGPGGLLASMGREELARVTREDLAAVPGAAGVNNHMGSRLTESRQAMAPVMETLAREGLFFLDSVTSPRSQAQAVARQAGLAHARRDVFLDHEPGRAYAELQISRLIRLAQMQGRAIAIGHPHQGTLEALTAAQERLRGETEVVPVSRLLSGPGAGASPSPVELDSQPDKP